MKFAIPLSMLPIDEIKPLAVAADQMGYDSLAVSDHLIHPETFSVPTLTPMMEALGGSLELIGQIQLIRYL